MHLKRKGIVVDVVVRNHADEKHVNLKSNRNQFSANQFSSSQMSLQEESTIKGARLNHNSASIKSSRHLSKKGSAHREYSNVKAESGVNKT